MNVYRISYGLGWFSIGLGALEILANRGLSEYLGLSDKAGLIRAFGGREIAAGVGILSQRNLIPWLWGRVGGDALDLAVLGSGLAESNPKRQRAAIALVMVSFITLLDVLCALQLSQQKG